MISAPILRGSGSANERYLFEAKGTTALSSVEKFVSKAIEQVKLYPEEAEARFAVVSYISADERFFPSTSFVVDPPSLPQGIEPDPETALRLHFERVLQYVGLTEIAKEYLEELAKIFAEARRGGRQSQINWSGGFPNRQLQLRLENALRKHLVGLPDNAFLHLQEEFVGRILRDPNTGIELYLGVARSSLEAGINFRPPSRKFEDQLFTGETVATSLFQDGTLIQVSKTIE